MTPKPGFKFQHKLLHTECEVTKIDGSFVMYTMNGKTRAVYAAEFNSIVETPDEDRREDPDVPGAGKAGTHSRLRTGGNTGQRKARLTAPGESADS